MSLTSVNHFARKTAQLVGSGINFTTILDEHGADETRIDHNWAVALEWQETPDQEDNFDQPVEWKPTEDDVREKFTCWEEGEHHPIG